MIVEILTISVSVYYTGFEIVKFINKKKKKKKDKEWIKLNEYNKELGKTKIHLENLLESQQQELAEKSFTKLKEEQKIKSELPVFKYDIVYKEHELYHVLKNRLYNFTVVQCPNETVEAYTDSISLYLTASSIDYYKDLSIADRLMVIPISLKDGKYTIKYKLREKP